jgi:hypothetical protein
MRCLLVALILLVGVSSATGKNNSDQDGSDWQVMPQSLKLGYVSGFVSAMHWVNTRDTISCVILKDAEDVKKCEADLPFTDYTEITIGDFVDGMNAFYKDLHNREMPMIYALSKVRDQIKGESADQVERDLVAWRRCHADLSKCSASK